MPFYYSTVSVQRSLLSIHDDFDSIMKRMSMRVDLNVVNNEASIQY